MKYFVIQFMDGCQIVPRNWLDSAKEYCAWPPWSADVDQRKYDKAVEQMMETEESWKKYPVEKIRASGDDFKYVRKKLNEARAFSDTDLNSSATVEGKKKRRKIARINWPESSDSDDEFPQGKSLTESTSLTLPTFNGSESTKVREEAIVIRGEPSGGSGDQNPGPSAPKKGRSNFQQKSLDAAERMTDIEFKAYVISTLTALRTQVSMLSRSGCHKCAEEAGTNKSTFCDGAVDTLQGLPALNVEEWLNFNLKLKDPGFANDVERVLAQLGGSDLGSVIRGILKKVMSNSVGALYSWQGGRGKRSMENSPFTKVLMSAVRQNAQCEGVTEKQIVAIASKWLSLAPQRGLKRRGKEDAAEGGEESSAIN